MATVTAVNSKGGLGGSLRYISQDKKAMLKDGRRLVSGVNCLAETAQTEFMTTKRSFNKTSGRQFYHFVQSFHPNENITPERVHQIGLELAEKRFPGFEVVVATHVDAEHLHSHLIVNSVSFETGKKLHQSRDDLLRHRAVSDEICLAHGLTVLPPNPARGSAKGIQQREYRAAVRGDSWKFRLMNAIDHCMNQSHSRRDFIENMRQLGYGVAWSDTRKYITYTCPNGKKCRDNRLHDAKYLKEMMQGEFEYRQTKRAEPARVAEIEQTISDGGLRGTRGTVGSHNQATWGQPSPVAGGFADSEIRREGAYPDREYEGAPVNSVGAFTTGWEESRRELEAFEGAGAVVGEAVSANPEVNPAVAVDGLHIASDVVRLAHNLNKMSDESPMPLKPKAVHERKRAIGQKRDDREREHELTI